MECWIGVATEDGRRVLRVAGRLGAVHVSELVTACAGERLVNIDLTELVSADDAGIEALQRARTNGATLVGTPGYIQLKIDVLSSRRD